MNGLGVGVLLVILMPVAAAAVIFWPLRAARVRRAPDRGEVALEIARDSKLGEINDLEQDFRLGKLSREDYQALNATLRSEAIEILRDIGDPPSSTNGHRQSAAR